MTIKQNEWWQERWEISWEQRETSGHATAAHPWEKSSTVSFVMQEGKWCVAPCFAFITALSHRGAQTYAHTGYWHPDTYNYWQFPAVFILTVIHSLPRTLPSVPSHLWVAHLSAQSFKMLLRSHWEHEVTLLALNISAALAWFISLWKKQKLSKTN